MGGDWREAALKCTRGSSFGRSGVRLVSGTTGDWFMAFAGAHFIGLHSEPRGHAPHLDNALLNGGSTPHLNVWVRTSLGRSFGPSRCDNHVGTTRKGPHFFGLILGLSGVLLSYSTTHFIHFFCLVELQIKF
eukprot:EG_transcript_41102